MRKAGYGDTDTSCMGCDPALPDCYTDCQGLVDQLYFQCDSVCLPEGYYFDPRKSLLSVLLSTSQLVCTESELQGCWEDVKPDVKIKVERCGCNSAFTSVSRLSLSVVLFVITLVAYTLL